jgi:CSLREA domain-containing protein
MRNSFVPTNKLSRFALRLSWFLALTLVLLWLVGVGHASAPIVVNDYGDSKGDDGVCTLREAIIAANKDKPSGASEGECDAGNGADTIILPSGSYILTRTDAGKEDASQTGDLDITDDLTIEVSDPTGAPAGATIAADGFTDRIIHIIVGNVTISSVTIKDGNVSEDGGGIYNGGVLNLANVTVSGNWAGVSGGGIFNAGTLNLNNVTVANNTAVDGGGGIANDGAGTVYFQNTILAGNSAASAPDDCSGTLSSLGHNLIQDISTCTISGDTTGNIIGQDPLLGPLQDNGGGTLTHALPLDSPAIDAGDDDTCEVVDQRGEQRPQRAACDIGAFEAVDRTPVAVDDLYSTDEDTPLTIEAPGVLLNDSDPDGDTLTAVLVSAVSHGTLTLNGDGSFTYVPDADFNGTDTFTYQANDGFEPSNIALVTITVNPINDAPLAVDDAYSVDEDATLSADALVGVLANDSDVDVGAVLTAILVSDVSHGTLTLNADGSFTYIPTPNFEGTDSFSYRANDGTADSNIATVTIDVIPDGLIEVTNTNDSGPGTLRQAILDANLTPEQDIIIFEIPSAGPHIIQPTSALPVIVYPVIIDATMQPEGTVILDGSLAGEDVDGLTITAGESTISGLTIINFDGNGILLDVGDNNTIEGNTIAYNGGDGIRILYGSTGNVISGNDIHDNEGLGIDLGGDGPTPNDPDDPDTGANYVQNYPVLFRAFPTPSGPGLAIDGYLNSQANTPFALEFFASETCIPGEGGSQTLLGSTSVETDDTHTVYFHALVDAAPEGQFIVATATDPYGNTSEFCPCISISPGNDSWPRAMWLPLTLVPEWDVPYASAQHFVDLPGLSRWYKFQIEPNSEVIVTLTGPGGGPLPDNFDLAVYKDIAAAYQALTDPASPLQEQDLLHLGAEFAPGTFMPGTFMPGTFMPGTFMPGTFMPDIYAPGTFMPGTFMPGTFMPGTFMPDIYAPGTFMPGTFMPGTFMPGATSPGSFSPGTFMPGTFMPGTFMPGTFMPGTFMPEAFSSAQTRSLIGFSAFEGTSGEGIYLNTWSNTGDFYVRVAGRNGAYDPTTPFSLQVWRVPGGCETITDDLPETSLTATAGEYKTIILTDMGRMLGSAEEKQALQAKLETLGARPEVAGVVVDVGDDLRVAAANAQANDDTPGYNCPYAKNLVAEAIVEIVARYRALNPLEYVVIVGGDNVIPYWRYPDNALLGHESNYVPPVLDHTASQASLRLGYVLTQDGYGAQHSVSLNANTFPLPDLAVGRLVETPGEVVGVLDAYLDTPGGVVTPQSALVTGYDFVTDTAEAVLSQLQAGMAPGAGIDTLISSRDLAPFDPATWTAGDLGALVLNNRYDVAYLAGHFSANSALAADYTTSLLTTDLAGSTVDMHNALFFSAGCHSGYNIVAEHAVPGVTLELDWAQAFAQKGATLIGGTGYQYGDTDFIEYSERLYLEFSRQLRTGEGPIPIGKALVAAKQDYLLTTPVMRGIHEKTLLEATLFGLPMLSINMPGERLAPQVDAPIVTPPLDAYDTDPGATLGLESADVHISLDLDLRAIDLKVVDENGQLTGVEVTANWLDGDDGYVSNPTEPVLPLELKNVTVPGTIVRGALWLGGQYEDLEGLIPLTGAPATEIRGVHIPFYSPVYYPIRFWKLNHLDALFNPGEGITQLALTPAQFKSYAIDPERGTMRKYKDLDFRLYYSTNVETWGDSTPALADAPTIVRIAAVPAADSVVFSAHVVGNPAAGVQEVWVTYTGIDGSAWRPLQLVQDSADSTLWKGTLALNGADPCSLRYMVQAVNGLGLVSLETDIGALYSPCAVTPALPTDLSLAVLSDVPAPYGSQGRFRATLTSDGAALPGQYVVFTLGSQVRIAATDAGGQAEVSLPLLSLPGTYQVGATFYGAGEYEASFTAGQIEIVKAGTLLTLEPDPAVGPPDSAELLVATLTDWLGRPLNERKTIFFVPEDSSGSLLPPIPVLTDPSGRAILGRVDLPVGDYTVTAYFNGTIPVPDPEESDILIEDPRYEPSTSNAVTLYIINNPPDCSGATSDPVTIWPPDKDFWPVEIVGVVDPDGDPMTIAIDLIFQDEKVGKSMPDGYADSTDPSTVWVRAERDGNGDGRVYTTRFTATDEHGATCQGEVRTGIVTHDQSGDLDILDSGPPWYDSMTGDQID